MPGEPFIPTYLSLQTVRAAAILLPAGAWDVAATELYSTTFCFVTFYMSYTRGGAAGAFDFTLEVSPYSADVAGVEDWFQQGIIAGGAVAAAADTTSLTQREIVSYGATAAPIEDYVYGPVELRGTVERLRMPCAESGNVGAPGTVHIVAMFT